MKRSEKTETNVLEQTIYLLKLYVAGNEQNSRLARENLETICNLHLKGQCKIEEVDVMNDFTAALEDRIFVTPTLILIKPVPSVTIVGNLSDTGRVISALRLKTGKNVEKAR